MIILDTNVISELTRQIPDNRVLDWLDSLKTTLATRNTADFEETGIELIDPWQLG